MWRKSIDFFKKELHKKLDRMVSSGDGEEQCF
jgi:hypothetical protein